MSIPNKLSYEPESWEEVPCPFCNSRERRLHERYGWRRRFTYVSCQACGLVYQSPRPRYDDEFIRTVYDDYAGIPDFLEASDSQRSRWQASMDQLVAEIVTFDPVRSSILDVGSFMGTFLTSAKPHWKKATGIDVSARMREYVEREVGVQVLGVPFEALATGERFSCIHMSHVIEHVPNPSAWLDKAQELLAEDGLLVIAVPNKLSAEDRFKRLLKNAGLRREDESDPSRTPDHLFEPTIPSMLRFLDAHGFDVVSHYTYSRTDETSVRPFNRLYRRRLLLGSNARFYARRRKGSGK
jgi:2-polyprenyl-3-methyl-5-hydroxy-6-metoxy-1,4-benzoquinol methylase